MQPIQSISLTCSNPGRPEDSVPPCNNPVTEAAIKCLSCNQVSYCNTKCMLTDVSHWAACKKFHISSFRAALFGLTNEVHLLDILGAFYDGGWHSSQIKYGVGCLEKELEKLNKILPAFWLTHNPGRIVRMINGGAIGDAILEYIYCSIRKTFLGRLNHILDVVIENESYAYDKDSKFMLKVLEIESVFTEGAYKVFGIDEPNLPQSPSYIDHSLMNDRQFLLEAMRINPDALLTFPLVIPHPARDPEFVLEAMKINPAVIEVASSQLKADPEFMQKAVVIWPGADKFAQESISPDSDSDDSVVISGSDSDSE